MGVGPHLMELELSALLRVAWAALILPILVASLPLPFTGSLHGLVSDFAGRGKTAKSSSSKFNVPQRYFVHFYVVAVLLTTPMLLTIWFYGYKRMSDISPESLSFSTIAIHLTGGSHIFSFQKTLSPTKDHIHRVWRTVFVLLMMEIQVLTRLHESLNVFNYSPSARMHIFAYLTGILFYVAAPLSLGSTCILEAVSFLRNQVTGFIVVGRAGMPDVEVDWMGFLKPLLRLYWYQWLGAALFSWGWLHQRHCHKILGSLREDRSADEYLIPGGDWFDYVSCAHYLAEIVLYAGMLVASGFDFTVFLLFAFVVTNLVFAAAETHRWYKRKFEDYPCSRRAVIPFVY